MIEFNCALKPGLEQLDQRLDADREGFGTDADAEKPYVKERLERNSHDDGLHPSAGEAQPLQFYCSGFYQSLQAEHHAESDDAVDDGVCVESPGAAQQRKGSGVLGSD